MTCPEHEGVKWFDADRPCFVCDVEGWADYTAWLAPPVGTTQAAGVPAIVAEMVASGHWPVP